MATSPANRPGRYGVARYISTPAIGETGRRSARLVARRFATAAFTIVLIVLINFVLFRVLPGDPARRGSYVETMTIGWPDRGMVPAPCVT